MDDGIFRQVQSIHDPSIILMGIDHPRFLESRELVGNLKNLNENAWI
jgi:hypothetical protein